ncbi:laccase domain-containing protein [Candidatus Saccharibacteria bacterium]|nr:laccase domain-containing protein [Candidatus Saccharibacteria bacterium]
MTIQEHPGLRIIVSDKRDGNMRITNNPAPIEALENQTKIASALDLPFTQALRINTTYGRPSYTEYLANPDPFTHNIAEINHAPVSDGILVSNSDTGIILTLADCLGIVLFDPTNRLLMLVHSGRRNIGQDGPKLAVEFMKQHGADPSQIHAYFSPSADADVYPLYKYDNKSQSEVATEQLLAAGIPADHIHPCDNDISSSYNLYWSNHQDDKSDRFVIAVRMT